MEVWKSIPIKPFESYEVSSTGNVRNSKTKRVLKSSAKEDGYFMITLAKGKKNSRSSFSVHRLVALTFIPNPLNMRTVNHKDHDPCNNHVNNLEWMSQLEQNLHSRRGHLKNDSASRPIWKCDPITGERLERYTSITQAAKEIGNGNKGNISTCLKGGYKSKQQHTAHGFKWEYAEYEDIEGELWKEVDPQLVNGISNIWISSEGRIKNKHGKVSEGYISTTGYSKVCAGKKLEFLTHVLVAKTFLPNFFGKEMVNHKDGNKSNPRLWNLEWATASENSRHGHYMRKNTDAISVSQLEHVKTIQEEDDETLDVVKQYVSKYLIHTKNKKDYVARAKMFPGFNEFRITMIKRRIFKTTFLEKLKVVLDTECIPRYKHDRNVFFGWKVRDNPSI